MSDSPTRLQRRYNRETATNFVLRAPDELRLQMRARWWRVLGARVGPGCRIHKVEMPRNPWDIELGAKVILERDVVLMAMGQRMDRARICLGEGVYINRFCMLDAIEHTKPVDVNARTAI